MATIVSRDEQEMNLPAPNGGMNTKISPQLIPDDMSIDASNVLYNEVYSIDKRAGNALFNSNVIVLYSAGSISSISSNIVTGSGTVFTGNINVNDRIIFGTETTFYTVDAITSSTAITISATHATLSTGYKVCPNKINKVVQYTRGTTSDLVAFAGKSIFTGGTGLSVATMTERTGATLTNNNKVSAVIGQDILYFCDGSTSSFQTMNTSYTIAAVGGSPPTDPKFVSMYTIGTANFLAVGGHTTNRSRIDFSDANAFATWPAVNQYLFGDRDGTDVSGFAQQGGVFVVFKLNTTNFRAGSIYEFSGVPGTGQIRLVVPDIGCLSHHTIVPYEGTLIFFGVNRDGIVGVYQYNGTSQVRYLSESIEATLQTLSFAGLDQAEAYIYKNQYFLGVRASGSYNNRTYVGNLKQLDNFYKQPKWSYTNRSFNSGIVYTVSGQGYPFYGSATNGFVYRDDTGNSDSTTDNILGNGAAISAYVDSKWFSPGNGIHLIEGIEDWIEVTDKGSWNLVAGYYKDWNSTGSDDYNINLSSSTLTWADVVYLVTPWQTATDKHIEQLRLRYPFFVRYFKKRYKNANSGEPFAVYPSRFVYKLEQRG